jgi:predicted RNase H-like HicB family nuclease
MRLTAAIMNEPPWYVARCLEVEVASQGATVDEALANLKEALELYFEDAPVPDLSEPPIIASFELGSKTMRDTIDKPLNEVERHDALRRGANVIRKGGLNIVRPEDLAGLRRARR